MSGQVFHDIAEGIMAKNIKYDLVLAKDDKYSTVPEIKWGNNEASQFILSHFNLKKGAQQKRPTYPKNQMPDVTGMGARDAVYIIESRGGKVVIQGTGKVRQQSKPAGSPMHRNEKIVLKLA